MSTNRTTRVGIIGWPLTFTLSPAMHNAAFDALGLNWHYDTMAIPPDIARMGLTEPQRHGYVGINVTIPHKETLLPYVRADDIAKAIGAVNTVDLRTASATNTDAGGFIDDLSAHDLVLDGASVIVLGAGGAARAAVFGLTRAGARVYVASRSPERDESMLTDMRLRLHDEDLAAEVMPLADALECVPSLVVNCTPVGGSSDTGASPWPDTLPMPRGVTVYDMVYRPARTRLMQQAEAVGGRGIGGLGMLVRQGAASFQYWTRQDAPLDVMFAAARQALTAVDGGE